METSLNEGKICTAVLHLIRSVFFISSGQFFVAQSRISDINGVSSSLQPFLRMPCKAKMFGNGACIGGMQFEC